MVGLKGDDERQTIVVDGAVILANEVLEAVFKFLSTAESLVCSFRSGIEEASGSDQRGNDGCVGGASGRGDQFGNNGGADVLDNVTSVVPVGAVDKKEVGERDDNGVQVVEQKRELGVLVVVTEYDLEVKDLRVECTGCASRRCGGGRSGWSHGGDMRCFVWRESKARA